MLSFLEGIASFALLCFLLRCFVVTVSRGVGARRTEVLGNGFRDRGVREGIVKAFLNAFPKHFGRAREKVTHVTVSGTSFWAFGLSDIWTFGLRDFWTFRLWTC